MMSDAGDAAYSNIMRDERGDSFFTWIPFPYDKKHTPDFYEAQMMGVL